MQIIGTKYQTVWDMKASHKGWLFLGCSGAVYHPFGKGENRCERIITYIRQRMEGISSVSGVLADRALKIGALSFLILFLRSYIQRQNDSLNFIIWSIILWMFGIGYSYHLLRCGEKKDYEIKVRTGRVFNFCSGKTGSKTNQ